MINDFQVAYFACQEGCAIALKGECRFTISEILDKAYFTLKRYGDMGLLIFDLTQVTFIDSTILGLIAGYALQNKKSADNPIAIYYLNHDIGKQFYILGLDQLCLLKNEPSPFGAILDKFTVVTQTTDDEARLKGNISRAHQTLARLTNDPAMQNVADIIRKSGH